MRARHTPGEDEEAEVVVVHPDTGAQEVVWPVEPPTTEMVRRVAEAIASASEETAPWMYVDLARAAIEAMREPTEDMQKASRIVLPVCPCGRRHTTWGVNAWDAIIDAVLSPDTNNR